MKDYQNFNSRTGIEAFEDGDDFIRILFKGNNIYRYESKSAGKEVVEEMKRLANEGEGLTAYINTHKPNFIREN